MKILTVDKLKNITAISSAVDSSVIEPFIEVAEIFHLIPIIGENLYFEILENIENNTLSGDCEQLVNDYIIPTIAYYAWYEASPYIMMRTENKGIVKKFSDNSNSINSDDFKIYRQSILDKCVMYGNRLKNKLFEFKNEVNFKTTNSSSIFLNF